MPASPAELTQLRKQKAGVCSGSCGRGLVKIELQRLPFCRELMVSLPGAIPPSVRPWETASSRAAGTGPWLALRSPGGETVLGNRPRGKQLGFDSWLSDYIFIMRN